MALVILLNGCASTFNGKQQKVTVVTQNSNSKVYVNDQKQGQGEQVLSRLKRDKNVQQIKIETEGYKDQYFVAYQTRRSPLYFFSVVPFGVLYFPILFDNGNKAFNYKKSFSVKESPIAIRKKREDEKFLFVKNTEFDIGEEGLKISRIKLRSYKKNKKDKFKNINTNDEDITFDNSIFTESLNNILLTYNYTDTTKSIFKSKSTSAYLSAKITKLDIQYIYRNTSFLYSSFYKAAIEIEWSFLDFYGQEVYTKKSKSTSGDFSYDFFQEDVFKVTVEDAISASFLNFINEQSVRDLLKKGKSTEPQFDVITMSKGKIISNLDEAIEATVTVQVKEGHGSGFKVSSDGHIITNFHVVANSKDDITVITKDNQRFKAKIIRQNEELDLALIKIDSKFEKHFAIPQDANYSTGQDVFVVGTPQTIELGQTITKGIISGSRVNEGTKLIQTDASINGGNSGGPMISTDGKLIGIVNAKLSGFGVEGIGFAIPAALIKEALSIK